MLQMSNEYLLKHGKISVSFCTLCEFFCKLYFTSYFTSPDFRFPTRKSSDSGTRWEEFSRFFFALLLAFRAELCYNITNK